jgi:uncharacterized membrane protein
MKEPKRDIITGLLVGISIVIGIYILSFVLQVLIPYA